TLAAGRSTVAATAWIKPDDGDYPLVEKSIVNYEYDPRRSVQLIEELGYTRGPDGLYRDGGGGTLSPEIRTTTRLNETYSIVDYWKRVGVDAQSYVIPRQQGQDLEYRTQFSAFEVLR